MTTNSAATSVAALLLLAVACAAASPAFARGNSADPDRRDDPRTKWCKGKLEDKHVKTDDKAVEMEKCMKDPDNYK